MKNEWNDLTLSSHDRFLRSLSHFHDTITYFRYFILVLFGSFIYGMIITSFCTIYLQAFDSSWSPSVCYWFYLSIVQLKIVLAPLLIGAAVAFFSSVIVSIIAAIISIKARTLSCWKLFLNNIDGIGFSMCCFFTIFQIYKQLPLNASSPFSFTCLRWFQISLVISIIQFILTNPENNWHSKNSSVSFTFHATLLTTTILYELASKRIIEPSPYIVFLPLMIALVFAGGRSIQSMIAVYSDSSSTSNSSSESKITIENRRHNEEMIGQFGQSSMQNPRIYGDSFQSTSFYSKRSAYFSSKNDQNGKAMAHIGSSPSPDVIILSNTAKMGVNGDITIINDVGRPTHNILQNKSSIDSYSSNDGSSINNVDFDASKDTIVSLSLGRWSQFSAITTQEKSSSLHSKSNKTDQDDTMKIETATSKVLTNKYGDKNIDIKNDLNEKKNFGFNPQKVKMQDAQLPPIAIIEEGFEGEDEDDQLLFKDPEAPLAVESNSAISSFQDAKSEMNLKTSSPSNQVINSKSIEFRAFKDFHLPSPHSHIKGSNIDLLRMNSWLMSQPFFSHPYSKRLLGVCWHFFKFLAYVFIFFFLLMIADSANVSGHSEGFFPPAVEKSTTEDLLRAVVDDNQFLVMTGVTDPSDKATNLREVVAGTRDAALDAAHRFRTVVNGNSVLLSSKNSPIGTNLFPFHSAEVLFNKVPEKDEQKLTHALDKDLELIKEGKGKIEKVTHKVIGGLVNDIQDATIAASNSFPQPSDKDKTGNTKSNDRDNVDDETDDIIPWYAARKARQSSLPTNHGNQNNPRSTSLQQNPITPINDGQQTKMSNSEIMTSFVNPFPLDGSRYVFFVGWMAIFFSGPMIIWALGRWLESQAFDCLIAS